MKNGTTLNKWILGILAVITVGWIAWVSNGIVAAQVREEKICALKESIMRIERIVERLDRNIRNGICANNDNEVHDKKL